MEYLSWEELEQLRGRQSVSKWAQRNRRNVLTKRPAGAVQGGEETWTVYLSVYKTARWTGVDITELDAELFPQLCSSLDDYLVGSEDVEPLRAVLEPNDEHAFLFMSKTGTPLTEMKVWWMAKLPAEEASAIRCAETPLSSSASFALR